MQIRGLLNTFSSTVTLRIPDKSSLQKVKVCPFVKLLQILNVFSEYLTNKV